MAETVRVGTREEVDWDGNVVPGSGFREIHGCVVSPAGESRIDQVDVDGNTSKLQVLAPAGTAIAEGDEVTIRGLIYQVQHVPFDWSVGRRPANPRHRPKVSFIVERGEG